MNAELLAALNPPRLQADMVATGWADALAAFGLGLLLAAGLVALAGPLLAPRRRPAGVEARLAALRALPPGERLLAQARLLAEAGARLPPDLRTSLYAGAPHDPAEAEALIRAAWRAAGPRARGPAPPPGPAGSPPAGPSSRGRTGGAASENAMGGSASPSPPPPGRAEGSGAPSPRPGSRGPEPSRERGTDG